MGIECEFDESLSNGNHLSFPSAPSIVAHTRGRERIVATSNDRMGLTASGKRQADRRMKLA
jgi:hypothetical protein